jgi:hypothetical protein
MSEREPGDGLAMFVGGLVVVVSVVVAVVSLLVVMKYSTGDDHYWQTVAGQQLLVYSTMWIVIFGLVGALVGRPRGLAVQGFVAGVFLGPIGILLTALSRPRHDNLDRARRRAGMRRCPHCAEWVQGAAAVCRFCGRNL